MFDMPIDHAPAALQQSTEYMRTVRAMGAHAEQLVLTSDGQVLGQVVMQARWWPVLGWIGLISRGPVWVDTPNLAVLTATLDELKHPVLVNADGLSPQTLSRAGFLPVLSGAHVVLLDLCSNGDQRRAAMHQKWRNRLRTAERGPLVVRRAKLPSDHNHWIFKAEATQRQERGYRGLPGSLAAQFAISNPGCGTFFWAELRGEPVAAMAFLRHGAGVSYFLGHSTKAGREQNAHNIILSKAADWYADQGAVQMDLGCVDTVNAPGLARFKLGIGARAHALGGTWLYTRATAALLRSRR